MKQDDDAQTTTLVLALQRRLADYTLGLSATVRDMFGVAALGRVIMRAAEASATQKFDAMRGLPTGQRAGALANRLVAMLAEFCSKQVRLQQPSSGHFRVVNPKCGCIPPFTSQAGNYGFDPKEARRYACMRCMPGYSKAARLLGAGFKGHLTERGCIMEFANAQRFPQKP